MKGADFFFFFFFFKEWKEAVKQKRSPMNREGSNRIRDRQNYWQVAKQAKLHTGHPDLTERAFDGFVLVDVLSFSGLFTCKLVLSKGI